MRTIETQIVIWSAIVAVGVSTFSTPAAADHRWRLRHIFFPSVEVYPGDWDEDDDYVLIEDDEFTDEDYERIIERRAGRIGRYWWLYEDEGLEPELVKPKKKPAPHKTAKPSAQSKTIASKAAVKPAAKPASLLAKGKAPAATAADSKQAAAPVPGAKPAALKSIGCTAGAAVVTGYGFGDVKPKICTGTTYAYTASRGGKVYEIKLTAATGEVVDVKKL